MPSVEVTLPRTVSEFVALQVRAGHYRNVSEYVAELLRNEMRRHDRRALDEMLLAGVRSPKREMTRAEWDEIRVNGLKRAGIRRKKKPYAAKG